MVRAREINFEQRAAIEIVDRSARLVIVHGVGPRIAFFGRVRGDNLLFWDRRGEHRRGDWHLYGGHRLWVARPGADEAEETYAPDNAPCAVRRISGGVEVTAPPDAARIEKTLVVRAPGERSDAWIIEHRLRNAGDMLWSGGAWALTATLPARGTRYRIPLGGGAPEWDLVTLVIPRRWGGGHTSRLADPQFSFTDDALEFRARGHEAKRMVMAPHGTLEMSDPDRGRFVKRAAYVPHQQYPLGTNLATYLGPKSFMVELETMSPLVTLAPNETLVHVETWSLRAPTNQSRGAAH